MNSDDLEILKACRLFNDADVPAILIGGAAAILHGSGSMTQDMNFCCPRDPDVLHRIADVLTIVHARFRVEGLPDGYPTRLDARTLRAGDAFAFLTDLGNLDMRFNVTGIGEYDRVAALTETRHSGGVEIRILSLDGLIQSKQRMNRPRDRQILPELEMMREALRICDEPASDNNPRSSGSRSSTS